MNYPIVTVKTADNLTLYGLFLEAPNSKTIFINTHGTASNFYEENFIEVFAKYFIKNEISLLSTNNRGAGVYDAYQKTGAAVEYFEDCVLDIDAWISFATEKGYTKIILSGHSLGTEKVVYYMGHGDFAHKVSRVVLLAPADSYGSHRMHEGAVNPRKNEIGDLLNQAIELDDKHQGDDFLSRNAYGSHDGIMPKSANSFINFLGEHSKLGDGLPFVSGKLQAFSKIDVPILVAIGDQSEFTGIKTTDALKLMRDENKRAVTHQLKNCDHDFDGKEDQLAEILLDFIRAT